MREEKNHTTLYDRKKLNILLRVVTLPHSLNPPLSGFFVPEKRDGTLNVMVIAQ
ncbi:hypothetical protein ECAD30_04830 [Escherichia coli AD30]|nr:hypothetical protein ECAD30_04830 [Escherichia coli AD30]